jgi:hypothetical protein
MVLYVLKMKAELENIATISIVETTMWEMDFQQSGGSEVKAGVVVSPAEELELEGSKGTAHAVLKCVRSAPELIRPPCRHVSVRACGLHTFAGSWCTCRRWWQGRGCVVESVAAVLSLLRMVPRRSGGAERPTAASSCSRCPVTQSHTGLRSLGSSAPSFVSSAAAANL